MYVFVFIWNRSNQYNEGLWPGRMQVPQMRLDVLECPTKTKSRTNVHQEALQHRVRSKRWCIVNQEILSSVAEIWILLLSYICLCLCVFFCPRFRLLCMCIFLSLLCHIILIPFFGMFLGHQSLNIFIYGYFDIKLWHQCSVVSRNNVVLLWSIRLYISFRALVYINISIIINVYFQHHSARCGWHQRLNNICFDWNAAKLFAFAMATMNTIWCENTLIIWNACFFEVNSDSNMHTEKENYKSWCHKCY